MGGVSVWALQVSGAKILIKNRCFNGRYNQRVIRILSLKIKMEDRFKEETHWEMDKLKERITALEAEIKTLREAFKLFAEIFKEALPKK